MRALLIAGLLLLGATVITASAATLQWDPNAEPGIAGYRVYTGPASRSYAFMVDVGNVTAWRVTNATPGVTNFYAVTAYNVDGLESDKSNEVSWRMPYPRPLPPLLALTETNTTEVTVMASQDLGTWKKVGTLSISNGPADSFFKAQ